MGGGDPADEWCSESEEASGRESAAIKYLQEFDSRANYVQLGDTWELRPHGQAHLEDILKSHRKKSQLWTDKREEGIIIPGNHDRDVNIFQSIRWRVWPSMKILEYGDWRLLLLHGDRFDEWNKEGASIGQAVTQIAGIIERLGWPNVDHALNGAWTKATDCVDKIDAGCAALAKELKCNAVIHGHDHYPHLKEVDGLLVADPGTWVRRFDNGYPLVRVEPKSLTLEWRS